VHARRLKHRRIVGEGQAGSSVHGRLFSFLFTFLFTCEAGNGGVQAGSSLSNDLGAAVRAQPGQHSYVWLPRGIPHREAQGQPAFSRFYRNPLATRARTGQVVHAHHHSLIAPSALGLARPQTRAGRKIIHRGACALDDAGDRCEVPRAQGRRSACIVAEGAGGKLAMQSPRRLERFRRSTYMPIIL
jgi:hypothetical protein